MAEAEDVITDAARHATVFAQELWRRRRTGAATEALDVHALLQRLDLFLTGAFGVSYTLRIAQPPSRTPIVRRWFRRYESPQSLEALPATDGVSIWLPGPAPGSSVSAAIEALRAMAMQQAAKAVRRTVQVAARCDNLLVHSIFEALEANAADADMIRRFPGIAGSIHQHRRFALERRPPTATFPSMRRALEARIKDALNQALTCEPTTAEHSLIRARALANDLVTADPSARVGIAGLLYRDAWTGELRAPSQALPTIAPDSGVEHPDSRAPRGARLPRRPSVRAADERDEHAGQGAFMVQTAQPNEHAEDPFGLQRPTDRDTETAAEEFADSVSELAEARLVSTPGAPLEVLISDDPPDATARRCSPAEIEDALASAEWAYPEWDWRANAYRDPGVRVHVLEAHRGADDWVRRTLDEHRALLHTIRRHFAALRARRMRLRQQADGNDPDLDACIDAFADARAGTALPSGLYETVRNARRDMAVSLLIDVSGSTDGWASAHRRVIDVEREALLLVCLALESLGEPYNVLAFSGEGSTHVTLRSVKRFAEGWSHDIALRIAGLEPERYTRAGAAIRHATMLAMQQAVTHRLLLILSDGKPNDVDEYDGRYGVEDMRQAVTEARLQGVQSFCLAVDRQTASYLPAVFGEHRYAVLHRPELLPTALVGWLRRLLNG